MSLFKQLAGQTIVYGFGHVLGKVLNYVLIAFYLTRKLRGQEVEYGIYNEMYFYVAILLILLGLRMETTFFRFGGKKEARPGAYQTGVFTMLITGLLWMIIGFVFSNEIAALLSYPNRGVYVQILSALLLVDLVIAMPLAKLRLEGRPGSFVKYQLTGIVLNIAFVLVALELAPLMGWYSSADILRDVFLANLLARFVLLLSMGGHFKDVRFDVDFELWKKMLSYAWPLVLVGLAGVINQSSYIFLQKYFLQGEVIENIGVGGVYAAAAKVALLMSIFVTAYNFAAEPFFFNQFDRKDAPYIYAQMARAFSWIAGFLFLVITLYMGIFEHIVDASYRSLMFVVPIILIGYLLLGLYYNVAVWYKVSDHTLFGAIISIAGAIVTIGINLWLLPQIGVMASAWGSMACYGVMLALCHYFGKSRYPVPYDWWAIFRGIGAAILLFYLSEMIVQNIDSTVVSYLVKTSFLLAFIGFAVFSERKKWQEWIGYV